MSYDSSVNIFDNENVEAVVSVSVEVNEIAWDSMNEFFVSYRHGEYFADSSFVGESNIADKGVEKSEIEIPLEMFGFENSVFSFFLFL